MSHCFPIADFQYQDSDPKKVPELISTVNRDISSNLKFFFQEINDAKINNRKTTMRRVIDFQKFKDYKIFMVVFL